MKRLPIKIVLAVVFLALLVAAHSAVSSESIGKLIVDISGFPSSDGFAMVALHNSEESYKGGEDKDDGGWQKGPGSFYKPAIWLVRGVPLS